MIHSSKYKICLKLTLFWYHTFFILAAKWVSCVKSSTLWRPSRNDTQCTSTVSVWVDNVLGSIVPLVPSTVELSSDCRKIHWKSNHEDFILKIQNCIDFHSNILEHQCKTESHMMHALLEYVFIYSYIIY